MPVPVKCFYTLDKSDQEKFDRAESVNYKLLFSKQARWEARFKPAGNGVEMTLSVKNQTLDESDTFELIISLETLLKAADENNKTELAETITRKIKRGDSASVSLAEKVLRGLIEVELVEINLNDGNPTARFEVEINEVPSRYFSAEFEVAC